MQGKLQIVHVANKNNKNNKKNNNRLGGERPGGKVTKCMIIHKPRVISISYISVTQPYTRHEDNQWSILGGVLNLLGLVA